MFTHLSDTAKAAVFYVITLALALLVLAFVGQLGETSLLVTMATPAISVLLMLLVVTRDGRVGAAWRDLGITRIGLRGWPLAIVATLGILVVSYFILWATPFADIAPVDPNATAANIATNVAIGLVVGTIYALFEEVGWRGYMLPRLTSFGAVPAMLIVGFAHGLWHLPLLIGTPFYHSTGNLMIVVPLFVVTLTLAGLFYGYLRLWTGSVWPVAIAHGVYNLTWNFLSQLTTTNDVNAVAYVGGESGVLVIVILLIAAPFLIAATRRAVGVRMAA